MTTKVLSAPSFSIAPSQLGLRHSLTEMLPEACVGAVYHDMPPPPQPGQGLRDYVLKEWSKD